MEMHALVGIEANEIGASWKPSERDRLARFAQRSTNPLGALASQVHRDREEHASDPLPPYSRVKIDSPGADGIDW